MTTAVDEADERAARLRRRRVVYVLVALAVVALGVCAVVIMQDISGTDRFSSIDAGSGDWAYLAVFTMIVADAICALFPGETTLNAASTLAADGVLQLGLVMLAGAAGAIVGDSSLYWIARLFGRRVRPRLEAAQRNDKVRAALDFMGSSAPVLLILGRYVPGLRFVVNATFGLAGFSYRRFLLWSSVGGTIWSVYTCGLAYLVGTALAGYPLASIVISSTITSVAIVVVFLMARHSRRRGEAVTPPG